jgi:acyl-CoA reductase-like NAD-dependent aldehyde dehydrogenase
LRTEVRKTYKLFIGGAFPRSESGRSYMVQGVNAAQASRKDARDAVAAARKAVGGWSGATAYNRGQVLYRIAEMLEARRAEFDPSEVDAAIDRWVWYAGWSDKLSAVAGSANPVAGPYFNFSVPEPTGVVAVLAPTESPLLGLVSVLAPVIVSGNTAVVLAAEQAPVPAITLAEVLAVSDVPPGVVNVLTGRLAEVAQHLAAHMDVNALDLCGAPPDLADELTVAAAGNLKRVVRLPWDAPGTDRMLAYLETKTVWHPAGP